MIFAQVVGTVVATRRADDIRGAKYLLVEQCSCRGEARGRYHVALDVVDAGVGEMVMIARGSSCRQTALSERKPVDALICGIVDLVDEQGQIVYRK
jgi:ethanolamine utilization protein EutN/carbon dioxide concentrating mechanism protein CcmL